MAKWHQKCGEGLEFIFDGPDNAGEGEHKLLQYIKKNLRVEGMINNDIIIYGLDADLFFLSLASQRKRIYLMRELQKFDPTVKVDDYQAIGFCSIDFVHDAILTLFHKLCPVLEIDTEDAKSAVIQDFIFLCYLLGNDFIPGLPSIDIYNYF